jgi:hypothetical protein
MTYDGENTSPIIKNKLGSYCYSVNGNTCDLNNGLTCNQSNGFMCASIDLINLITVT